MILAITGHRPHKLGGYIIPNPVANAVMLKLADSLKVLQPSLVLSGMALGVDQWTAQLCNEMQIPFDAVIAFEGYESKWPQKSQEWYHYLMKKARRIYMLSPGPYRPSLLHARNHWLVDNSNALLAVWDGLPGSGTAACVEYAQLQNPPKPAYKLDLPEHIWAMAREDAAHQEEKKQWRLEMQQREEEDRRRRNADFMLKIHALDEPKKKVPAPSTSTTVEYRRFVDVGEDDS